MADANRRSSITSDVKENFPTQVFFSKLVLGSEGREDPVIRNVQVSMGKKDYKQLDEFRQAYAHIAGVFDPDVDEISRDVKKGSEAFKISPRIIFGVEQLNDKSSVLKWESLVALIFKRVSEKYHKHQNAKQWDDLDEDKRNGFEAFLWLCIWHYFQGNPMVTCNFG